MVSLPSLLATSHPRSPGFGQGIGSEILQAPAESGFLLKHHCNPPSALAYPDPPFVSANPDLGKALAGIWYETMAIINKGDGQSKAALEVMAKGAGTTPESLEEQIRTTYFYTSARDAAAYAESPDLITVTDRIRQFSYSKGLFGPSARSVDAIGIAFPGGKVLGDKDHVMLRFDPTYMKLAATGL